MKHNKDIIDEWLLLLFLESVSVGAEIVYAEEKNTLTEVSFKLVKKNKIRRRPDLPFTPFAIFTI